MTLVLIAEIILFSNSQKLEILMPLLEKRSLYIHTYIHTDRQTDRQTDMHTYRHTDRQTDRQTDKQTDRQTDSRQTDRHQKEEYNLPSSFLFHLFLTST